MRELIRGTLLSKTTERESNEGWLYRSHQHQQFHKSRDSRQQTLLAASTQGLTLPPPVLPDTQSDGPAALAKALETNQTFNSLGIDSNIYYFFDISKSTTVVKGALQTVEKHQFPALRSLQSKIDITQTKEGEHR